MKTQLSLLLILLTLIVPVLACEFNPEPLLERVSTNQAEPTLPPTEEPRVAQNYTISPTSVISGLDTFDSYHANLIVDFEGTRGGQPAAGHIESLERMNRQDPAQYHYLNIDARIPGTPHQVGISEFFGFEDKVYVRRGDETLWFEPTPGQQISSEQLGFLDLNKLIILPGTVSTAPRPEVLEGLDVQHYSFSHPDLADPSFGFKQAVGDVWVLTDNNSVMQYTISATLTALPPLPNAHLMDEGQLTLRYTLSNINANVAITPPEQTGNNALTSLPLLPDAKLDAVFPALIEYTSAISPVSATLFYQEQLVNAGWAEETTTFFNEKARLAFSKDDEKIMIIINPTKTQERIKVVVSKP